MPAKTFGKALASPAQAAEYLGITKAGLWKMIARGEFPKPIRITKKTLRWEWGDIEAYVNEHRQKAV